MIGFDWVWYKFMEIEQKLKLNCIEEIIGYGNMESMNPTVLFNLALCFVGGVAGAGVLWNQLHDPGLVLKFILAFAYAVWLAVRNKNRWAAVAMIAVSAGIAFFEACHQPDLKLATLYMFVYAFVVVVEWNA